MFDILAHRLFVEQQCGPSGQRIRSDIFDGEIYLTDSFVIGFNIE